MGEFIIIAFCIATIALAIVEFLKTPPQKRYRLSSKLTLEERLAALPVSAEAVVIKADIKRALKNALPAFFLLFPILVFTFLPKIIADYQCEKFLGIHLLYLNMSVLFYWIPFSVLYVSIIGFNKSLKTLKTGYFPPLDSAVLTDTIAKKGNLSKSYGIIGLLLPLLAISMVYVGHGLQQSFTKGKSNEFKMLIEENCKKHGMSG
jgi:hypothetical protein